MTWRKWTCCLLFVATATAIAIFWVYPQGLGPTSFKKIRPGMTLQQVEEVFRLRHGDYYTRPPSGDWRAPYWGLRDHGGEPTEHLWTQTKKIGERSVSVKSWRDNYYFVHVAFDENGGAVAWSIHDILAPTNESFLDWIRRRLSR